MNMVCCNVTLLSEKEASLQSQLNNHFTPNMVLTRNKSQAVSLNKVGELLPLVVLVEKRVLRASNRNVICSYFAKAHTIVCKLVTLSDAAKTQQCCTERFGYMCLLKSALHSYKRKACYETGVLYAVSFKLQRRRF